MTNASCCRRPWTVFRRAGFAAFPGVARGRNARANPLRAFVAVTFAFSWTFDLIALAVLDLQFEVGVIVATFGPAVGAYAVIRAIDGRGGVRAWLRRFVQWRVDPRLYLFVLVALPAAVIASFAFLSDGTEKLEDAGAVFPLSFLGMLVILWLLGGGQEEPGWRGFALPRMLEWWGPVEASVRLGVVWAVWHRRERTTAGADQGCASLPGGSGPSSVSERVAAGRSSPKAGGWPTTFSTPRLRSALAIGREYVERDTGRAKSQEKSEIAPVLYSATARSSESRHSTNESLPSSGSGEG